MNPNKKQPIISVVIPCLNEEDYVGKLLQDLTDQNSAQEFEVMVVDSNSKDSTVAVAETFINKLPLTVIKLEKPGVSRARNAGAAAARGEWLFFFDADVRIGPNYVQKVLAYLENRKADFGTGPYGTKSWHPFDHLFFWLWSNGFRYSYSRQEYLMNGSTMFIKRSLHQRIGGFNEEIDIGEDIDYAQRLSATGGNGVFVSEKMYLSNRRLVQRGRITALLMAASWHHLLPTSLSKLVYTDYFQKTKKPPFWRRIIRSVLNASVIITVSYTLYYYVTAGF